MSAKFEELDWSPTPIGEVSLRRRVDPVTGVDIYEVKLGDEFLMSSMFTAAEIALSRLALERLAVTRAHQPTWDVVVGGLGLGYTAHRVLEDPRVRSLVVVELLEPVIDWHQRGLVPVGPVLTADARCRLVQGDFFAMARSATAGGEAHANSGFDPEAPGRIFDAVVLDIDHAPDHFLDGASAGFYSVGATRELAEHLAPGGVYAIWSNDPPDQTYVDVLSQVFDDVVAEVITFPNPLQDRDATATVYVGTKSL
ncbi:MAG: spermidine synthase [Actinobacteria bacterium HGW-Actinobacteria-4]|nr:MAG: spermidine synthase [Actinobacteria bacterium HGW-Actinobacteria-4]